MYHITLSEEIKRLCPAFQGVDVMAQVTNSAHNAELWREIDAFTRELRAGETAESIKLQPAIAATREAYKRCGKDPSRYRPSAEALRRRLMRGLELYQIDTLVDLINLVSLRTGYSSMRTRYRETALNSASDVRKSPSKASGAER